LIEDKYNVLNAYEKYYIIAMAIDFTRFEIYNRDYGPWEIEWTADPN